MPLLLVRAFCIAALGFGTSWLLLSGNSPLSGWLVDVSHITNIASAVNLPTLLFALSGPPAPPAIAVQAVGILQWLAYGFAIAWIWGRLWPDASTKPNVPGKST